jgi:hypothetical protein
MSKEGLMARQFMLGVVQTADGLLLYHEVFDGNTAEVTTLKPTIKKRVSRFAVKRMIVVADQGLLLQDNLAELQAITLPAGHRYREVTDAVVPLHVAQFAQANDETLDETQWADWRLIVAHHPDTAATQTAARAETIAKLGQQATQWVGKRDEQDTGKCYCDRQLSDGGVRAKFYRAVCEAHLTRIVQFDLKSEPFTYSIDEQALQQAQLMDGKLLLITHAQDLSPANLVQRYKSLADIERGFRVLKFETRSARSIIACPTGSKRMPQSAHPVPGNAPVPAGRRRNNLASKSTGSTAAHPASPHYPQCFPAQR